MRILPIVCIWTKVDVAAGDGEVRRRFAWLPLPRYAILAAKQNHEGEEYPLVPLEARSRASHSQYFAALNDGFDNLPEDLTAVASRLDLKTIPLGGFVDSEHYRKWALCQTGHCDVMEFDFDSVNDARTIAKLYRRKDTYAQIMVRGAHVTIKEAKSQSAAAMAKAPFEASKRDVLNLLETMVGVAKGALMKQAGKSA
jgi:hypothetical protein